MDYFDDSYHMLRRRESSKSATRRVLGDAMAAGPSAPLRGPQDTLRYPQDTLRYAMRRPPRSKVGKGGWKLDRTSAIHIAGVGNPQGAGERDGGWKLDRTSTIHIVGVGDGSLTLPHPKARIYGIAQRIRLRFDPSRGCSCLW